MRNLIMLATIGGVTFLTAGASAAPIPVQLREPIMQQADWYCGPECQRHRALERMRVERREQWRESRQYPYRSYNNQYYRGY